MGQVNGFGHGSPGHDSWLLEDGGDSKVFWSSGLMFSPRSTRMSPSVLAIVFSNFLLPSQFFDWGEGQRHGTYLESF